MTEIIRSVGRLQDKVTLVTGAASGIGRETAVQFAKQGAYLILTDIDAEGLKKTAALIGPECETVDLDVTDDKQWGKVAALIHENHGCIDVIVNSAGIGPDHDNIEECSVDLWNRIVGVNLTGVFLGCQTAVDLMKDSGGGSIINVASIRSVVASPKTLAYSATKSGVLGLTKSVAMYCAERKYGIRANAICPGAVTTAMHDDMLAREAEGPDTTLEKWIAEYPIGRLGIAEDIAMMAIYLASDESGFVTGAHFMIDGGFTAK